MDLRRDQTCAVEEILGDLRADPEWHLGVLHHSEILGGPSAVMISRSAARRLTWGAAPPRWSQTTAPSSASRLHLLPLGRVALHLITVGGNSSQRASECDRLLQTMISYLRRPGYLLISASLLAAGSFSVACALSCLLFVGAILATCSACCLRRSPSSFPRVLLGHGAALDLGRGDRESG
jgi:hypothetical protein